MKKDGLEGISEDNRDGAREIRTMEAELFNEMTRKDASAFKKVLFTSKKGEMRSQTQDGTEGD